MKNPLTKFCILLLATYASFAIGCSDDGTNTTATSGSGSSSSSGNGGAGGGSNANPSPGMEMVSGGDVVKSNKFKMVVTFGPSTPAGGTMQSPKFKANNGLVGVTEGSK